MNPALDEAMSRVINFLEATPEYITMFYKNERSSSNDKNISNSAILSKCKEVREIILITQNFLGSGNFWAYGSYISRSGNNGFGNQATLSPYYGAKNFELIVRIQRQAS